MIFPDKKKVSTVIVQNLGKASSHEEAPEAEMDIHNEALRAIAQDILQALSDKSPHDLAMALTAFLETFQAEEIAEGE